MNEEYLILKIIEQTGLSRKEIFDMIKKKVVRKRRSKSICLALNRLARDLCIRL